MLNLFLYTILITCCLYSGSFLLLFTAAADYFLIFTGHYIPGILFFLLFQFGCRRLQSAPLSHMLLPALCATLLLRLTGFSESVILLSVFYAICLCSNLILAWKNRNKKLQLIFLLLLLCDLHVALANMNTYFPLTGSLLGSYPQQIAPYVLWLFYLPSQFLLAGLLHGQNASRMRLSPRFRWASSSSPSPRISRKQ